MIYMILKTNIFIAYFVELSRPNTNFIDLEMSKYRLIMVFATGFIATPFMQFLGIFFRNNGIFAFKYLLLSFIPFSYISIIAVNSDF
jgi:hypothetical protein